MQMKAWSLQREERREVLVEERGGRGEARKLNIEEGWKSILVTRGQHIWTTGNRLPKEKACELTNIFLTVKNTHTTCELFCSFNT